MNSVFAVRSAPQAEALPLEARGSTRPSRHRDRSCRSSLRVGACGGVARLLRLSRSTTRNSWSLIARISLTPWPRVERIELTYASSRVCPLWQGPPQEAGIDAAAIGGSGDERRVLQQRVLHDPEQCPAVWRDRQTLHAAVGLATGNVVRQFRQRIAARVRDPELGWHLHSAHQVSLPVELHDVRPVLVRHVERPGRPDLDTLRIQSQCRQIVAGVEGVGGTHEPLSGLVFQQTCIEELRPDVGKRRAQVGRHVQKVDAVDEGRVGQTVERSAVRCRDEDVVVACIGDGGAKAAEDVIRTQFCGLPTWHVTPPSPDLSAAVPPMNPVPIRVIPAGADAMRDTETKVASRNGRNQRAMQIRSFVSGS